MSCYCQPFILCDLCTCTETKSTRQIYCYQIQLRYCPQTPVPRDALAASFISQRYTLADLAYFLIAKHNDSLFNVEHSSMKLNVVHTINL